MLQRLVEALQATERCHTCIHLIGEEAACDMHRRRLEAALGEAREHLNVPQTN
jgi:hypothetical protein